MFEEIDSHPLVGAALVCVPEEQRQRVLRELQAFVGWAVDAQADRLAHELLGAPRRAPVYALSLPDQMRREAERREHIPDVGSAVFNAAADAWEALERHP